MKIVNIIGGLGNQMFQYAFACRLKEMYPEEEVLIDTSHFHHIFVKKWKTANLHNGFEINKVFPNATLLVASPWQLMKVSRYIPNYLLSRLARKHLPKRKQEFIQSKNNYFIFQPSVFEQTGDVYYEGLWESVHYYISIREKLRKVYEHSTPNLQNADYINRMEKENSVGIHIRRGDYLLTDAFKGLCQLDYYKKAIEMILSDGRTYSFYIFSNDIEWCGKNIVPLVGSNKISMVTNNTGHNSCWDMFLMTHCKDLIIANSSFSWWGAFMNKNPKKIVVAPKKWYKDSSNPKMYLDNYIVL